MAGPQTNSPAPNAPAADPHAGHGMEHSEMPSMARLRELEGEAFDVAFLSEMIEHHQGALEMSEKAREKLKRPEVKAAAEKIVSDQKEEITQMTGWVREWSGKEPDPELRQLMKTDMSSMMTAFEADCETDCDRAFLTHMRAHHQMAVEMAKMAQEKAVHPELKELAGTIIKDQTGEMEQFEAWLEEGKADAGSAANAPAGRTGQ